MDTQVEQQMDTQVEQEQQEQQRQNQVGNQSSSVEFLDLDGIEHVRDQIIDLMDTDLGNPSEMEEAIKTLKSSSVRTIMISSGAGISKYNRERSKAKL